MSITDRRSHLSWEVIIVYGPDDHGRSAVFHIELKNKVERCSTPMVVAEDFNLIRWASEKSSSNVDRGRMCMFNDCIADLALREIARVVTRIGSDHTPLLFSSGEGTAPRTRRFCFETFWLEHTGYEGLWANLGADLKACKGALLDQIQVLDSLADGPGLSPDDWLRRYSLEASLMCIYESEELFWQRRWGQDWLLKGDASTAYFHAIANGRRRKCAIPFLWDRETLLESQEDISSHVYSFYKSLFLRAPWGGVSLFVDFWTPVDRVSDSENAALTLPFSPEQVHLAIASMKSYSAPGPDGLRINYGVISLIPKVVGSSDIRQFCPIAVINVLAWIFVKVCATRLSPVAEHIAHPLQSAFLKGTRIHDGILALHEIVHEVASKGLKGIFLKVDFQKTYDNLDWSFLRLVMQRCGFDERWCSWVMQLVGSGSTAINVNGDVGSFFHASRGVKQGDPISPVLFNLAVDALVGILDKARLAGHLKGVADHLIPGGGVTHLQYADDTTLMVAGSDRGIAHLKFLLLRFEEMLGLKINFDKREVVVLGFSEEEQHRIADNLNFRLASFPVSYLGMPLAESRILVSGFDPLVSQVASRAEPWCGRFTSKGSKTIIIGSNLSSLPMYMMGLYILPESVHSSFDKELARFFWQAGDGRPKYHMVKWADICLPKDRGGLGILASRRMNVALMLRWVWRITRGDRGLWLRLLEAKYLQGIPLLACSRSAGSQFWKSIQAIKEEIRAGLRFSVHNGSGTQFWLDPWLDGAPLRLRFPGLFAICAASTILVSEAALVDGWHFEFYRSFSPTEVLEWNSLREVVPLPLSPEPDSVCWNLSPSGELSVSSAYQALCRRPVLPWLSPLWKAPMPLKIKIFVWQLLRDRLPSGTEVLKRHGPGNGLCPLCQIPETGTHILLSCISAQELWCYVREALGPEWAAHDFAEFLHVRATQDGRKRRLFWLVFAALTWTLWTTRNKMVIERVFPRRASDSFFKFLAFLQLSHPLVRP
uniref:Reverse transcriptase domain-containing protein n=1 Tax=Hordeum vulgare subsp. vulgare TaxID=112509 RepID=A0A8I6X3U8_HORVV